MYGQDALYHGYEVKHCSGWSEQWHVACSQYTSLTSTISEPPFPYSNRVSDSARRQTPNIKISMNPILSAVRVPSVFSTNYLNAAHKRAYERAGRSTFRTCSQLHLILSSLIRILVMTELRDPMMSESTNSRRQLPQQIQATPSSYTATFPSRT